MSRERGNLAERKVACPTCGRIQVYSRDNKFRPFCSERCKMVDLGQWANERYRISVSDTPNDPDTSVPD
ncbi:MAG: DNA gyrase inhibitor YacG [Thiobacillaceae bacterium]